MQLLSRRLGVASPGLGRDEKRIARILQPRLDSQLGVAVRGRDVDVVDPVLDKDLERSVGRVLRDRGQGGPAEDHAAAPMFRPPEALVSDRHP